MSNVQGAGKVAIYWDFENIHAILNDREYGEGDYVKNRYRPQDPLVEIEPVVDFAATIGDIVVHKAYCNWQFFGKYQTRLNTAGMDLIQIFARGWNAKNGADISLALDALTDVQQHPHITHVVIVSNDTDFVSLAQKVKQSGRTIIGVGLPVANRFWQLSCNEFRQYDALVELNREPETAPPVAAAHASAAPAKALLVDGEQPAGNPVDIARSLLTKAMRQLTDQRGDVPIPKTVVKNLLKRLDASFDEKNLGFETFTLFLNYYQDVARPVDSQHVISATASVSEAVNGEPPMAEFAPAEATEQPEQPVVPLDGDNFPPQDLPESAELPGHSQEPPPVH